MKNMIAATLLLALLPLGAMAEDVKTDTLNRAVVTGTRAALSRDLLPSPISVVTRKTVAESDEAAVLPSLMEQVPGLFVTSRGVTGYGVSGGAAGGISLRGFSASSGRVLVLIDGHPQYEAIYGHPVADEYTAESAERVEVSRGASSVLYGSNAMGGAINIITRKPHKEGNSLDFKVMGGSYGTMRASITDTWTKGRFSITASAGHDRTAGHRANSSYHSTNGMLKAGYKISDHWNLSANANFVSAFSENPGSVSSPIYDGTADIKRLISGISVENNYGRMSGAVNLYYNYGDHTINDGHSAAASPQQYLFHGTDYQGGANIYETATLFSGNDLTAGLDFKLYGGNAYRNPVTEIYADHLKLNEEAIYLLDRQTIGKVSLSGGLRLERNSLYGLELVPQAGISYAPDDKGSIKLSASKGFRTPNLRELYMYAVANEELLPEKAWSFDLSASRRFFDDKLEAEACLFYTKGSNIVEVTVVDGIRRNRNAGAFANSGAEASLTWRPTDHLRFSANYSYLHMDKILTGAPVHKLYASATWLSPSGRLSATLSAMTIADLYLSTGDSPVTSNYTDVKLRVSYRILDYLTVFARGENLLNRQYETMLGFPVPGATALFGLSISL